jgi:hypothetical protein
VLEEKGIGAVDSFDARLGGVGEVHQFYAVGGHLGFVTGGGFVGELVPGAGVCPLEATGGFSQLFDGIGDENLTIVAGIDFEGRLRIARYARLP